MFGRAVKFRDFYFDFFPVERASKRLQDISEIVAKSLNEITELGSKYFLSIFLQEIFQKSLISAFKLS